MFVQRSAGRLCATGFFSNATASAGEAPSRPPPSFVWFLSRFAVRVVKASCANPRPSRDPTGVCEVRLLWCRSTWVGVVFAARRGGRKLKPASLFALAFGGRALSASAGLGGWLFPEGPPSSLYAGVSAFSRTADQARLSEKAVET